MLGRPMTRAEMVAARREERRAETLQDFARRLERRRAACRYAIATPDPEHAALSHCVRLWRCKAGVWSRDPARADRLPGTVARRIARLMRADGVAAEAIRIPSY